MLVCVVGKTLGAVGCFAISQHAKPLVERLMRRHRRLRTLERTVHAHPLKATMLVRFSMLPAPVKNYGWGSLGVDFRIFLVATLAEVRRLRAAVARGARASHPTRPPPLCAWQAPLYSLPPVLLGGQLSDLADVAAGRQRIRPNPFQLGLGLAMLLLLVLLAATSHRWLEAEQREHGDGEHGEHGDHGATSELTRGIDDTEAELVLAPTRTTEGAATPLRVV